MLLVINIVITKNGCHIYQLKYEPGSSKYVSTQIQHCLLLINDESRMKLFVYARASTNQRLRDDLSSLSPMYAEHNTLYDLKITF